MLPPAGFSHGLGELTVLKVACPGWRHEPDRKLSAQKNIRTRARRMTETPLELKKKLSAKSWTWREGEDILFVFQQANQQGFDGPYGGTALQAATAVMHCGRSLVFRV